MPYQLNTKLKYMDSVLLTLTTQRMANSTGSKTVRNDVHNALAIAARGHIKQFRKSPRTNVARPPYIEHPLRVAIRAYQWEPNPNNIVVGLLHDTLEDCGPELTGVADPHEAQQKLHALYVDTFGESVARSVRNLSNPKVPQSQKNVAYQRHVMEAVANDPVAMVVKASDLVDNAGSLIHTHLDDKKGALRLIEKYTPTIEFIANKIENPDISRRLNKILEVDFPYLTKLHSGSASTKQRITPTKTTGHDLSN